MNPFGALRAALRGAWNAIRLSAEETAELRDLVIKTTQAHAQERVWRLEVEAERDEWKDVALLEREKARVWEQRAKERK